MQIEIPHVTSLESSKVFIEDLTVRKITGLDEIRRLSKLQRFLSNSENNHLTFEKQSFDIQVPKILKWDYKNSIIGMAFCSGSNLENILVDTINYNDREKYVHLCAEIISWMKNSGVLWHDAAPRNIILNTEKKTVSLVDFERPLDIKGKPYNNFDFKRHIRGNIHEEFCAFLFEDEQQYVFPKIWDYKATDSYSRNSITSHRQLMLVDKIFGQSNENIPASQLISVQKIMSSVVTPYHFQGKVYFPMLYLAKSQGPEEYINRVIKLKNTPKEKWQEIILN